MDHQESSDPQLSIRKRTVIHVISGLSDGGAEAVLYRLCAESSGLRHLVVSLQDQGKYGPLLMANGVVLICLGMPRGRLTLTGLWRLWRLLRVERPVVIQTWMYHSDLVGGVIARLAGQRNVVWGIHNSTLVAGLSPRSTILVAKLCARLSLHVPRLIVSCGEKARDVHEALGYDERRMRVIPNGYDLAVFRPDSGAGERVRQELDLRQADRVIGFVARYDPQKDHDTLLRALALLQSPPHCLLVGTGLDASNTALIQRIAQLGLEHVVHLLGRREDIPALMNALDLHVMSSAFGEAFPNVLAEAMACGTPCVTTDVGDAAEIVGPTGLIVPSRDAAALSKAISILMVKRDCPGWSERKVAARNRIRERYTLDRMAESYSDAPRL